MTVTKLAKQNETIPIETGDLVKCRKWGYLYGISFKCSTGCEAFYVHTPEWSSALPFQNSHLFLNKTEVDAAEYQVFKNSTLTIKLDGEKI